MTQRTVNNIQNKDSDIVLALGDFSYQKDTGCWFKVMSPLLNKTKIVIGEHDYDLNNGTRLQDYVSRFNIRSLLFIQLKKCTLSCHVIRNSLQQPITTIQTPERRYYAEAIR